MPARNDDLHGMVPDTSEVGLLLVDVINDLEFEGGERILPHALVMAERLAALRQRAKALAIPVIYANDNFGKWQSDKHKLIQHCLNNDVRGRPIVERLQPTEDDYFVLKPKHSAFFSSTLDTLLTYLKVKTLIITGMAGDICVFFTASDAYLRDYHIVVPADCVASEDPAENAQALQRMQRILKADITPSTELDLAALRRGPRSGGVPETVESAA